MKPKFITDAQGNRKELIMSMKSFDKIIEELEELEDIRLAQKALSEKGKPIPFEQCIKELGIKIHV